MSDVVDHNRDLRQHPPHRLEQVVRPQAPHAGAKPELHFKEQRHRHGQQPGLRQRGRGRRHGPGHAHPDPEQPLRQLQPGRAGQNGRRGAQGDRRHHAGGEQPFLRPVLPHRVLLREHRGPRAEQGGPVLPPPREASPGVLAEAALGPAERDGLAHIRAQRDPHKRAGP